MTELTEFLLARIAEDEAVAREAGEATWFSHRLGRQVTAIEGDAWEPWSLVLCEYETGDLAEHAGIRPARVLAECEAKRQLVELAQGLVYLREIGDPVAPSTPVGQDILEILAVPYADHPGFREEWRA